MATQSKWINTLEYFAYQSINIGLSFWKSPRSKLYAITHSDIQLTTSSQNRCPPSRSTFCDSSDDEDSECLLPKAKYGRFERILQSLSDEVTAMKETVTEVISLTSNAVMPMGLKRVEKEAFKCQICHLVPVQPPVIVT